MNELFNKNQIVENHLPNGKVIVCKVIESLAQIEPGLYRLADVRDCDFNTTAAKLIAKNKTWAAPAQNIRPHDADCQICHKNGLVAFN